HQGCETGRNQQRNETRRAERRVHPRAGDGERKNDAAACGERSQRGDVAAGTVLRPSGNRHQSCPAGTGTTDLKESLRVAAAGSAAMATSRIDPPRVESCSGSAHRVKESSQSAASISDLRNVAPQPRV